MKKRIDCKKLIKKLIKEYMVEGCTDEKGTVILIIPFSDESLAQHFLGDVSYELEKEFC